MTNEEIEALPWYEDFIYIVTRSRNLGYSLKECLELCEATLDRVYVPGLTAELRKHMVEQEEEVVKYIFNRLTN